MDEPDALKRISNAMIKVITLLTRKAGLSRAEFRQYYETRHRMIGEKYLAGRAHRYLRRYVMPDNQASPYSGQPDFDVQMEIWFPDQDALEQAMAALATPAAQAEIIADEEQLFDREKTLTFVVDEIESTLES